MKQTGSHEKLFPLEKEKYRRKAEFQIHLNLVLILCLSIHYVIEKKITIKYTILFLILGYNSSLIMLCSVWDRYDILKYYKIDQDNSLTCAEIGADMHKS